MILIIMAAMITMMVVVVVPVLVLVKWLVHEPDHPATRPVQPRHYMYWECVDCFPGAAIPSSQSSSYSHIL